MAAKPLLVIGHSASCFNCRYWEMDGAGDWGNCGAAEATTDLRTSVFGMVAWSHNAAAWLRTHRDHGCAAYQPIEMKRRRN